MGVAGSSDAFQIPVRIPEFKNGAGGCIQPMRLAQRLVRISVLCSKRGPSSTWPRRVGVSEGGSNEAWLGLADRERLVCARPCIAYGAGGGFAASWAKGEKEERP